MEAEKIRLAFVVNEAKFFLSHRSPLAREALARGWEVSVLCPPRPEVAEIEALGVRHLPVMMGRKSTNPLTELKAVASLRSALAVAQPHLVHSVTMKAVMLGGLATRTRKPPALVSAISGLGTVFLDEGRAATVKRHIIMSLMRLGLRRRASRVIFQNTDDRDHFIRAGAIREAQVCMIPGSGTDLTRFPLREEPQGGAPVVTLPARLLRQKGIGEFVEAARLLEERGVEVTMQVAGDPDPGNPSSIRPDMLEAWRAEGLVRFLGHSDDMPGVLAESNIIALPSWREGFPKALIEAAAAGRAAIGSDEPGCRAAIVDGVTGLLTPVRDPVGLADAIERLVREPDLRRQFGRAARQHAERNFTIEQIVKLHFDVYERALADQGL